jgi:hypothetical protein
MAQVSDLNNMEAWLEFPGEKAVLVVSKSAEFLNEEGEWEERKDTDFTTDEETGPVCISQGNEPTVNIQGVVRFKDGVQFDEPEGGWNLANIIAMIERYELQRRRKPENYFLGGFDNQHVLWAGMDKVDDHFVINWES